MLKCVKIIRKSTKIMKINPKSVPNPYKIDKKWFWGYFGAFSAPSRAQVGSRTLRAVGGTPPLSTFGPKMSLQGSILGSPEIRKWLQNRTLEDRRALWVSQNRFLRGSERGSEETWKLDEKLMLKWRVSGWYFHVNLCNCHQNQWFWHFQKKLKSLQKSRLKRLPKVIFLGPKSAFGRPRVDWFCHLGRFGKGSKNQWFLDRLRDGQKSIKIDPWRPKGGHVRHEGSPV